MLMLLEHLLWWSVVTKYCHFFLKEFFQFILLFTRGPSSRCGSPNRSMRKAESSVLTGSALDFFFYYWTITFIMLSSWTLPKGQHLLWFTSDPGLRNTSRLLSRILYVFSFCCFTLSKYKYLYVHEASFLDVLWTSTKPVVLWSRSSTLRLPLQYRYRALKFIEQPCWRATQCDTLQYFCRAFRRQHYEISGIVFSFIWIQFCVGTIHTGTSSVAWWSLSDLYLIPLCLLLARRCTVF